jgi:hypothetical protein
LEWLPSRRQTTTNVGEDVGEKGTLIHCFQECKLVQPLWKTVWRLLTKLKIELPYDPTIPLLGVYPKNVNQVTIKKPAHPCLLQHYSQ